MFTIDRKLKSFIDRREGLLVCKSACLSVGDAKFVGGFNNSQDANYSFGLRMFELALVEIISSSNQTCKCDSDSLYV